MGWGWAIGISSRKSSCAAENSSAFIYWASDHNDDEEGEGVVATVVDCASHTDFCIIDL